MAHTNLIRDAAFLNRLPAMAATAVTIGAARIAVLHNYVWHSEMHLRLTAAAAAPAGRLLICCCCCS